MLLRLIQACYLPETMDEPQMKHVPRLGLEPGTHRSGAQRATTELGRSPESLMDYSDSKPAYKGIRTLRTSKPAPRFSSVRSVKVELLVEESEMRVLWAAYNEQLYRAVLPYPPFF